MSASRVVTTVASVLLICACAAAGFALGRGHRTTAAESAAAETQARSVAYAEATVRSEATARSRDYTLGFAKGLRTGEVAGRRMGTSRGTAARAQRLATLSAASPATRSAQRVIVEHCPNGYAQVGPSGGCVLITSTGSGYAPGINEPNPYENPSENQCVKLGDCP